MTRIRPTHHSDGGPGAGPTAGRADLHVHTMASDGTAGVERIIDAVNAAGTLDILAIADHERVDAALAGRALARARGYRLQVVVGEEVSTRDGHLLALFLQERLRPWKSMRTTIAEVHEQGGLAIAAHPLFPYPLCAQSWTLRRLLASNDPRVRPDAIEAFNPTTFGRAHGRVLRFARETGLPVVGNSDAHDLASVGIGLTTFPGSTLDDLRAAILEGRTGWEGSFHGTIGQLPTFGNQLRKYGRDARDTIAGRIRRTGTGRDLGWPGGRLRPPRLVLSEAGDDPGIGLAPGEAAPHDAARKRAPGAEPASPAAGDRRP